VQTVPTSANEFIEQQLDERLSQIESSLGCSAVSLTGPLVAGVDDLLRIVVEDVARAGSGLNKLVVILTTQGGFIEVVQRIVETLRHHFDHVSFVVPNFAFSAGTVLAMSGDQIYMDYYSRLGPIDPQIPTDKGRMVPANGYLVQWERLIKKAQDGTLTLPEAQLMISGFDQAELYQFEQARELSITLLEEWLVNYKFKNWQRTQSRGRKVTDKRKRDRARNIARKLNDTNRWHSHGYGISKDVLQKELNLLIDDLDDDDSLSQAVRLYFALLQDYIAKMGHQLVVHSKGRYVAW
jgi:hypothetical protein